MEKGDNNADGPYQMNDTSFGLRRIIKGSNGRHRFQ